MALASKVPVALAALAAGLVCAPAAAQSTWNYASFAESGSGFGNSWSASQSGTTLTVSAFSSTGAGPTFATANVANYGSGSGFGIRNQAETLTATSPNHAMDNSLGTDMLALHFTGGSSTEVEVVLTSITSGWHNTNTSIARTTCGPAAQGYPNTCTDSDISLLRWGGSGTPSITGKTQGQLLADGWELVSGYANMPDDASVPTGLTPSSGGSSWWLISAYSSLWGGGEGWTEGDDFVKLLSSVSAFTVPQGPGTPEPGSLALAAAAALALHAMRRRTRRVPLD